MNISFIKEHGVSIAQAAVTSAAFTSNNSGASLITGLGATVLGSYGAIQSASKIWNGKRDVKEATRLILSLVVGTIGVYQLYSMQQQLHDVSHARDNLELQIRNNKDSSQECIKQLEELQKIVNDVNHTRDNLELDIRSIRDSAQKEIKNLISEKIQLTHTARRLNRIEIFFDHLHREYESLSQNDHADDDLKKHLKNDVDTAFLNLRNEIHKSDELMQKS